MTTNSLENNAEIRCVFTIQLGKCQVTFCSNIDSMPTPVFTSLFDNNISTFDNVLILLLGIPLYNQVNNITII